jgi:peptidyl-prolyl cis-trans isomerase A (cyclophilin A)
MRMRYVLPVVLFACGPESPTPMTPQEARALEVASMPEASAPIAVEDPAAKPKPAEPPVESTTTLTPLEEAADAKDPAHGKFTLTEALDGLPAKGPITATIATSLGTMKCKLFDDKAPITVANFVGLARGLRPWKDPTGHWVKQPLYDGTTFHRVIRGFMIQGGDPKGNGSGEPGYVIPDELWAGAKHDRAGLLCMANRGPNTNGAQFFITDASAPHLDRSYTIFGECSPTSVVHAIASTPVAGEHPMTQVTINSVTISR